MGNPVPRSQRRPALGRRRRPLAVRSAAAVATAPARHLTSRARRARADERGSLATAPRSWRLRGDLPGRHGEAPASSFLGLARADRRPRPHAVDPSRRASVAAHRPAAHLRGRREHGRTGNAVARRSSSAAPRRRGRVRLCDRLLPPLRRLRRPRPQGDGTASPRPSRGRRNAEHEPAGLPPPQPSALVGRDRPIRSSAADLVERRRRDRRRARRTSPGRFHRELLRLEPRGRVEKVTGSWSHTAESYRRLQLPGAVRWLGLLPDV